MHAPSYRHILAIALPMLAANLSVPLLGLVDTALLGHQPDAVYLAAAALGSQLINLSFWMFGFLRMGTTGFTARAHGARDNAQVRRRLIEACAFGAVLGLGILAAQFALLPLAIDLLGTPGVELFPLALEYASIRIWAAPAALMTYAFVGWLIGLQNTRAAMLILVSTNALNIGLDYLFIVVFEQASAGAARASLIAEYAGFTIGALLVARQWRHLGNPAQQHFQIDWRSLAEMFRTSRHLFVRTLCLLFAFLFFSAQSAHLGADTAAANAILLNLLALTAYAMDGFAYAAEGICGRAWGAGRRAEFLRACRRTTLLACAMAVLCSLVLWTTEAPILSLYTNLAPVKIAAAEGYRWLTWLPLIAIWCYQLDGIFIGVGHSRSMQNAMLFATLCVYLPLWWATTSLGNQGLWLAMTGFHLARVLSLGALLRPILGAQAWQSASRIAAYNRANSR